MLCVRSFAFVLTAYLCVVIVAFAIVRMMMHVYDRRICLSYMIDCIRRFVYDDLYMITIYD